MNEENTQDTDTSATPAAGQEKTRCRHRHRRCGRGARLLALLVVVGGGLFAWHWWTHSPAVALGGLVHDSGNAARYHVAANEFADRLVGDLAMPDAQREQARKIVVDAADDLQPLLEAHREARVSLYHALTADEIDPARLEALRVDEMKRADQASQRLVQAVGALGQLVSPAQRRALLAHWQPQAG